MKISKLILPLIIILTFLTHLNLSAYTKDGITYSLENYGTAKVEKCSINERNVIIPEYIYTPQYGTQYKVVGILDDAFSGCGNLESISIPGTVLEIGERAFKDCAALKSVSIPQSVNTIGGDAFKGCSGLEKAEFERIDHLCRIDFNTYSANPLFYAGHLYINGKEIKDLVIPEYVTSIGTVAFISCREITSVTIPESVKSIGINAFTGCSGLTSITLPQNLEYLGDGAFSACTGLTSVTIPGSVTKIGVRAFSSCQGLTEVTIPDSVTKIGEGAFSYCSGLTEVTIPESVTEIGEEPFDGCNRLEKLYYNAENASSNKKRIGASYSLKEIYIGENVRSIPEYAFDSLKNLDKVEFVSIESLCRIHLNSYNSESSDSSRPLYSASNICINGEVIKDLVIPESVTEIGEYTFYNWNGLTSVFIPESVTKIHGRAFSGCTGLTSVTIPGSVTEIGWSAFRYCEGLTEVTIPDSVTEIGSSAFSGCTGLTSVIIPNSVNTIHSYSFYDCTGLTSVIIPNSVTEIGYRAFDNCTGLKSVIILNPVTEIDASAFSNCTGLIKCAYPKTISNPFKRGVSIGYDPKEIIIENDVIYGPDKSSLYFIPSNYKGEYTVPESVTEIVRYAFYGCTGLTSVIIPNSVTTIVSGAFNGCTGLTSVIIPNSVTEIGEFTFYGCTGLTSVFIPESVTEIDSSAFEGCTGLTSVIIPNSVNTIGSGAFYGCTGLTSVFIPESVTEIDSSAFEGCTGLTSVIIPNSVTEIGEFTFYGCTGLTSVFIPESVTKIHGRAFSDCTGLTSVTVPGSVTEIGGYAFSDCTGLTSVIIPNSVNTIGSGAFYGCTGLTGALVIPESVTEIGGDAFSDCSGLESLYLLPKSVKLIDSYAFENNNFSNVYCTAVEPLEASKSAFGFGRYQSNATLHVPYESLDAYKDSYWGSFFFRNIEGFIVEPANIILNYEEASIRIDEVLILKATIEPENTTFKYITWSTDNEDVATVSQNGVVIGVSVGVANITAKCGEATATCEITVSPCLVESIELDYSKWNGFPGESFTISATVNPDNATDKTIIWNSSDPEVATVDETGLVIAVKPGSALITAITSNSLTGTCKVTVLPILVESITLDPDIIQGIIGEEFVIKASVLPEDASNPNIYWESSNTNVATVDQDGNVKINGEGTSRIFAYATDGSNVSGECFILGTSGIESILTECGNHISIYTPTGLLIKKDCTFEDLKNLVPGIYIFKSEKNSVSVMIR